MATIHALDSVPGGAWLDRKARQEAALTARLGFFISVGSSR
jgi:hypothetical protein